MREDPKYIHGSTSTLYIKNILRSIDKANKGGEILLDKIDPSPLLIIISEKGIKKKIINLSKVLIIDFLFMLGEKHISTRTNMLIKQK